MGALGTEELEFSGLDAELAMGDFGGAELPLELEGELGMAGAVAPGDEQIEELAGQVVAPELDLDQIVAPERAKRAKRKRAYVPIIDEQMEMSDKERSENSARSLARSSDCSPASFVSVLFLLSVPTLLSARSFTR